jgi:hypothetical protein
VVIFPGEVLAFQNIERQAHALRAPALGKAADPLRRHPILARTISRGKNERPFHMVWRLRAQPLLAGGANWTSLRAHRE